MKIKPHKPIRVKSQFRLVIRNLMGQKIQTLLSILAITLGVAMLVAGDLAGSGYRAGFEDVVEVNEIQQSFAFMFDIFETGLGAVGWTVLLTAGFLIYNSFSMTIIRRTNQIGSLRFLGSSRVQVVLNLVLEALMIGLLGTGLGFLMGYMLGEGLLGIMELAGFFSGKGSLTIPGILKSILLGMGSSTLAVLPPALRVAHIPPILAIKNWSTQRGSIHSYRSIFYIGLSLIAGVVGFLLISPPGRWTLPPWNIRLPVYFSILWIIGLGLSLPMMIGRFAHIARGIGNLIRRPALRLAADNFGRERQRVVWTVITFMVGITMVVSLSGILWFSLEGVLRKVSTSAILQPRWLLTRGGVESEPSLEALAVQPETIAQIDKKASGRASIGKYYYVLAPEISTLFDNFPSLLIDSDMVLGPGGFNFTDGNITQAKEIMDNGCGILLTPGVAHKNRVAAGDTLTLIGKSDLVDCVVAGIGSGGFIYPTSFISLVARDQFNTSSGPNLIYVVSLPGIDEEKLEKDLQTLSDQLGNELEVAKIESALKTVYDLRETMSGFLGSLLILAVIGAGLGIVNTTIISLMERRLELGLLRAVGASRGQIFWIVGAEVLLTGFIGGLLGLIAGAGVSMIYVLAHGGNVYGLPDLPLWQTGWESTWPALKSGLIAYLAIPVICAFAAWISSRSVLSGSPRETLQEIL